jgi:hypothetical protein
MLSVSKCFSEPTAPDVHVCHLRTCAPPSMRTFDQHGVTKLMRTVAVLHDRLEDPV